MSKTRKSESAQWADKNYPFRSELNEQGEIVYFVPVEANSYDAMVTLNAEENGGIRFLPIGPDHAFPVVFIRTTNAVAAYDQRAWLSAKLWDERKWRRHTVPAENGMVPDPKGGQTPDRLTLREDEQDPLLLIESVDLVQRIADFIDRRHPKNSNYRIIFHLVCEGVPLVRVAEIVGISYMTAYHYLKIIQADARAYRRGFMSE